MDDCYEKRSKQLTNTKTKQTIFLRNKPKTINVQTQPPGGCSPKQRAGFILRFKNKLLRKTKQMVGHALFTKGGNQNFYSVQLYIQEDIILFFNYYYPILNFIIR